MYVIEISLCKSQKAVLNVLKWTYVHELRSVIPTFFL